MASPPILSITLPSETGRVLGIQCHTVQGYCETDGLEACNFLHAAGPIKAVLQRTVADYEKEGFDPQSSSLETRLIQSQNDIQSPELKYKA
ncbi:pyridoxal kinase [Elaeis guineensis]|uniref:Pyridoxal kinase isoform X2 n=1 Tax=Elaeis guineensis var. tenera TaxID=51953 RepID=A0A6I9RFZ3_ELAGV|nr:pyridoxal kinase isoform X2 [Elaeis guineensis]